MVKVSKGIPDDTPENTVRAIREILEEEARELDVSFRPEIKYSGIGGEVTIDVNAESPHNWFRIFLSYVESHNLPLMPTSLGRGFINEDWDLELSPAKPFVWELYPRDKARPGTIPALRRPPTHHLDGPLLRRLLRERLERRPAA